jgi:5'-methylthioadenosine phosphorylase
VTREQPRAEIGVFGGSGLYALLEDAREVKVATPYGEPSDVVTIAEVAGRRVAFLPRHGRTHRLPPHRINYRANVWAMKSLGVEWVFGPCAAGSLQPHVRPGEFVVCDQFVDRTTARIDTFADGPIVTHVAGADPYCPTLRPLAVETAKALGIPVHDRGTVVVIQGPRFSTRAESRWFQSQGWEVINMTNYPECILARELEMCYVNVSLITDYDVGVEGDPDVAPVTQAAVMQVLQQNNEKFRQLLFAVMERLPRVRTCSCATALAHARVE